MSAKKRRRGEEGDIPKSRKKAGGTFVMDSDDDVGSDSELSGEEDEGGKNTKSSKMRGDRDRTKKFEAQLKRQGLDVSEEGKDDVKLGEAGETSVTREQIEKVFAAKGDNMESFSMGGYFDKTGSYVDHRKKEDDEAEEEEEGEQRDEWYEEWKVNNKKIDYKAPQAMDDEEQEEKTLDPFVVRGQIIEMLEPRETVLKALRRLKPKNAAAERRKGKNMQQRRRRKKESEEEERKTPEVTEEMKQQAKERKQLFEVLTGLAQSLMTQGEMNIYQETREVMKILVDREERKKQSKAAAITTGKGGLFWEYKFNDKPEVQGPFQGSQMAGWFKGGFFADAQIRRVGVAHGPGSDMKSWIPADEVSSWTVAAKVKKFEF